MKLHVDFYAEDTLGAIVDTTGQGLYVEEWKDDLFIFTCFALRSINNFGDHIMAKIYAGLLADKSSMRNLLEGNYQISKAEQLLFSNKMSPWPESDNAEQAGMSMLVSAFMAYGEKAKVPQHMLDAIDSSILAKKVVIHKHHGDGSKSFHCSYPPFKMDMHGFGIFGLKVNYYAFHAMAGLIYYLGKKHADNPAFKETLIKLGRDISAYAMTEKIGYDQPSVAKGILGKLIS